MQAALYVVKYLRSTASYGIAFHFLAPFKLRSLSGFLVIRCGGPISWKASCQEQCSRSTCEAKIKAINEATKEIIPLRYRCNDVHLPDSSIPTPLFNDNCGSVDWRKYLNQGYASC